MAIYQDLKLKADVISAESAEDYIRGIMARGVINRASQGQGKTVTAKKRKTRKPQPLIRGTHILELDSETCGPTPETLRHVRENKRRDIDVVADLLKKGAINDDHFRAAKEIERVQLALQRGLTPTAARYDMESLIMSQAGHKKPGAFMDPIDRMRGGEYAIYERRYLPWAKAASKILITRKRLEVQNKQTWLRLTLAIVCDNIGPRQWETEYGYNPGRTATRFLRDALDLYLEN